jgi:manganese efflux pump family protein
MLIRVVALVLPLGLDTFAVAAALGATGVAPAERRRVSLLFTAFETGMPLIGVALGAPLGKAIGSAADYLAVAVLIGFGAYTLLRDEADEQARIGRLRHARGPSAILLGISISLDELAIGFTLGLLRVPAIAVIALIAIQTFIVTQLGLRLGTKLSESFREGAERLAGVALIALGAFLLAEQLL